LDLEEGFEHPRRSEKEKEKRGKKRGRKGLWFLLHIYNPKTATT